MEPSPAKFSLDEDRQKKVVGKKAFLKMLSEKVKQPVVVHSLITSTLLATSLGVATILNSYAEGVGFQWTKDLKSAELVVQKEMDITQLKQNIKNVEKNTKEQRIREQLQEIRQRAKSHINVMIYFYARYFVAVSLGTVSSLITGVCLFFISKGGWNQANRYVVNVFIFTSGSTIFFSSMPIIFKLEKNIADNKFLYLNYVALENEVLSYFATNEDLNSKKIDSSFFIHYLDQQLAKTNQLAVGFDSTQIPKYQDIYKDVQNLFLHRV